MTAASQVTNPLVVRLIHTLEANHHGLPVLRILQVTYCGPGWCRVALQRPAKLTSPVWCKGA